MNGLVGMKYFALNILIALGVCTVAGLYVQDVSGQTVQRQTPAASANLTGAEFELVINNLIAARQGIMNNNSIPAYDSVNVASSELFRLSRDAAGDNETMGKQIDKQLRPVQNNIDNTRDALRDENSTEALRSLGSADMRLLEIVQELPPGEGTNEETEDQ
jgi:hypothetical protein